MNSQSNPQRNTLAMRVIEKSINTVGHHILWNSYNSACAVYEAKSYKMSDAIAEADRLNGNTKNADTYTIGGWDAWLNDNNYYVIAKITDLHDEDKAEGQSLGDWIIYYENAIM